MMSHSLGLPGTPMARATPIVVVAAEPRHVDVGLRRESGAVALVAEPPHCAREGVVEGGPARHGGTVGEIEDGVEARDREAGMAVDHHILGGGGDERECGPRQCRARPATHAPSSASVAAVLRSQCCQSYDDSVSFVPPNPAIHMI